MRVVVLLCLAVFFPIFNLLAQTRITKVEIFDSGDYGPAETGGAQVDISRLVCSETDDNSDGVISDDERVLEQFFDTVVGIEVFNDGLSDIHFDKAWFKVTQVSGKRGFTTKKLALISAATVRSGEKTKLFAFFMKAEEATKVLPGKKSSSSVAGGFKDLTVNLTGRSGSGRVNLKSKTTVSFSDFDRCD